MSLTFLISALVISIILIILLTSTFKFNPFFSLIFVSLALALATIPPGEIVNTMKTGFGNTLASIGLIIIFGTAIGVLLDKTGATFSMANFILKKTGRDKAARAISITGFISGLPIFCDSGFIVLSGLNRSLSKSSGISRIRMSVSLAVAMYTVHCLVPPHPGITAAAGIMNGSLGKLILFGVLISLPTVLVAYLWIKFLSKKYSHLDYASDDVSEIPDRLPGTFVSFLPVVVPLLLITFSSFLSMIPYQLHPGIVRFINFIGDPVIALLIGVLLALSLTGRGNRHQLGDMFSTSIEKAGPILAIIAAGGAFGAVIKATGMGDQVTRIFTSSHLSLVLPFLLAAIFKTAQGSSTVAAITTASIIAPMMQSLGISGEWGTILALTAIGSGSMFFSHANDSYFWVITKFSDISSKANFLVYSSATAVVSVVSFVFIWIISFIVL